MHPQALSCQIDCLRLTLTHAFVIGVITGYPIFEFYLPTNFEICLCQSIQKLSVVVQWQFFQVYWAFGTVQKLRRLFQKCSIIIVQIILLRILYLKIVERAMLNTTSNEVWPFIVDDDEINDLTSRKEETDSFGSELCLPLQQNADGPMELFQSLLQDNIDLSLNTPSFFLQPSTSQKTGSDLSEAQPSAPQQSHETPKDKKIVKLAKGASRHPGRPAKVHRHTNRVTGQTAAKKSKRLQKNIESLQDFEEHSSDSMGPARKCELRELSSDQVAYECFLDL